MTKQEEIDWGLRKLVREWTGEEGTVYLYDFSKAIRAYLRSQGVVIKVKCPDCEWSQVIDGKSAEITPCFTCNSTGYIFEPLIEEEK